MATLIENKNNLIVGIDPSINSTGLTIKQNDFWHFYCISPHFTKAELKIDLPTGTDWDCRLVEYDKMPSSDIYYINEKNKSENFSRIVASVNDIVSEFTFNRLIVGIEGISYGSVSKTSAICDLAGLNYLFRDAFKSYDLVVIPPSDVKKYATGKGNSTKDVMCKAFAGIFPGIEKLKKYDDIADSFYIANSAGATMGV